MQPVIVPLAAKRVYIPTRNGKRRPLGITSVIDRCLQTMVKAALEPCWEAQFEPTSYGFRPGRSAQDAIARIYVSANPSAKSAQVRDVGKLAKVDPVLLQQLNWATHAFLTKWLNPQFHISQ